MPDTMTELKEAALYVKARLYGRELPRVAVILGTGWSEYSQNIMDDIQIIPFNDIPYYPKSTLENHNYGLAYGTIDGTPLLIFQGRLHYYEGHSIEETVFPIRMMKLLGIDTVILTNAAGGINLEVAPGSLMIIKDHISSFISSPLRGKNLEDFGLRYPDMSHAYDAEINKLLDDALTSLHIPHSSGVYIQFPGPQFETPAEIRMYKKMGADAVGMSTAAECIAARHCGMRVAALSLISNYTAGIADNITLEEIVGYAQKITPFLREIMKFILPKL